MGKDTDLRQVVGQRLRAAREHRAMSQDEAAREAEVTPTAWRNWERGRKLPMNSRPHRRRIAKAVGLTATELFAPLTAAPTDSTARAASE